MVTRPFEITISPEMNLNPWSEANMALPPFSPWVHWDSRDSCENRSGPGVYLLARFEELPPTEVDPTDEAIILIAETHGQTLDRRLSQFHYSAFRGKWGHAGGVTFHALFGNGPDTATPPWLYLSTTPVPPESSDVKSHVQELKNRLLEAYQDRHGLLPCCNAKGPVTVGGTGEESESANEPIPPASTSPPVVPDVQFGRWCRWVDRDQLEGVDAAGVYALACFDGNPPTEVDVLDERVVYLGETCDNTLSGRLWQFNRSAFQQKNGHSGGWSFCSRCADQGDKLHVAVFPVATLLEPLRSAFIRHTERRLLWEFVHRWGRRPVCNSK
jgi:hypothetical protein